MTRLDWGPIISRAREIVESYESAVTLRQLFYRLVAAMLVPNTQGAYKRLSALTAEGRRNGTFPALFDRTRVIHRPLTFDSPDHAREWLTSVYRRDRTFDQPHSVYLGIEKSGLVELMRSWFGERGLPVLSLGGWSSQSYVDQVREDLNRQGRRAVLLYAGDWDASGESIDIDFVRRVGGFDEVVRVALNEDQVRREGEWLLPVAMGKAKDPRAAAFVARHGGNYQIELDALPPNELREHFERAVVPYWDASAYERARAQERADLRALSR